MDNLDIKLAEALLIELEMLKGATLGYNETMATINRALNDARKLAELVKMTNQENAA